MKKVLHCFVLAQFAIQALSLTAFAGKKKNWTPGEVPRHSDGLVEYDRYLVSRGIDLFDSHSENMVPTCNFVDRESQNWAGNVPCDLNPHLLFGTQEPNAVPSTPSHNSNLPSMHLSDFSYGHGLNAELANMNIGLSPSSTRNTPGWSMGRNSQMQAALVQNAVNGFFHKAPVRDYSYLHEATESYRQESQKFMEAADQAIHAYQSAGAKWRDHGNRMKAKTAEYDEAIESLESAASRFDTIRRPNREDKARPSARMVISRNQVIDLSEIPDPAEYELPYEFQSDGAPRRRLVRIYKDLYKINPQFQKQKDVKEVGLALVEGADESFSRGEDEEGEYQATLAEECLSLAVGFNPVTSMAQSTYELFFGRDFITGASLSVFDRSIAFVGLTTGGFGNSVKTALKAVKQISKRLKSLFSKPARTAIQESVTKGRKIIDSAGRATRLLKNVRNVTSRKTLKGEKAIRLIQKDGRVLDINPRRVKEFVPNSHPKAPPGTLDKVRFPDSIPGSKGYKRVPTDDEIKLLEALWKKD